MPRLPSTFAVLAAALLPIACAEDADGGLEFHGEQDFLPGFAFDSGWLPADSPVAVRANVSASGGVTVVARATNDGDALLPKAGSGEIDVEGAIALELSASIHTLGFDYEGVVQSFDYAIAPASQSFDPFALDAAVTVASMLPPAELGRAPIPSVPGATFVLTIEGGAISTAFQGVCAESDGELAQYTGTLTTEGTVACAATIELDAGPLGSKSFGPFAIEIPIPAITTELDLGTLSLASGDVVDGMSVCDGGGSTSGPATSATMNTTTDAGETSGGDEGETGGSLTIGPTTDGDSSSSSTGGDNPFAGDYLGTLGGDCAGLEIDGSLTGTVTGDGAFTGAFVVTSLGGMGTFSGTVDDTGWMTATAMADGFGTCDFAGTFIDTTVDGTWTCARFGCTGTWSASQI